MSDHVYKSVELTGSSNVGTDDAVRNAIARASKTLHNLRWFEVTQVRGHLENAAGQTGAPAVFQQVSLEVQDEIGDRRPAKPGIRRHREALGRAAIRGTAARWRAAWFRRGN